MTRPDPNRVPNSFMSGFGGCLGVGFAILVVMIAGLLIVSHGCTSSSTSAAQTDFTQAPIAAASSGAPSIPAPAPAVSYDAAGNVYPVAACTQLGGDTIAWGPSCSHIDYLGSDGSTYNTEVPISPDGTLRGPADTAGTGATKAECDVGYYPDASSDQKMHAAPGRWNTQLDLCLP